VTFRLNTCVNAVNSTDNEVRIDLGDAGVDAVADVVSLALGIAGNVEHLGLEDLGHRRSDACRVAHRTSRFRRRTSPIASVIDIRVASRR
jgi:pyruvate/2-oxoglutarate dehydrogenase complex dihydrolipoamide dehydrogenase (E3) component